MLVDTQGHLPAVKVTGAQRSDQEGARALLFPLADGFPRMALVWGDNHHGGHFVTWMKVNIGWRMQTVKALTIPKRGILVPAGEEVDFFPLRFRSYSDDGWSSAPVSLLVCFRWLCRNYEGLLESSEAFIMLAASARMLTQPAPRLPS